MPGPAGTSRRPPGRRGQPDELAGFGERLHLEVGGAVQGIGQRVEAALVGLDHLAEDRRVVAEAFVDDLQPDVGCGQAVFQEDAPFDAARVGHGAGREQKRVAGGVVDHAGLGEVVLGLHLQHRVARGYAKDALLLLLRGQGHADLAELRVQLAHRVPAVGIGQGRRLGQRADLRVDAGEPVGAGIDRGQRLRLRVQRRQLLVDAG